MTYRSRHSTSSLPPVGNANYGADSDSDGQARGGRKMTQFAAPRLPTSSGLQQPAGMFLSFKLFKNLSSEARS